MYIDLAKKKLHIDLFDVIFKYLGHWVYHLSIQLLIKNPMCTFAAIAYFLCQPQGNPPNIATTISNQEVSSSSLLLQ